MKTGTSSFYIAYDSYYEAINQALEKNMTILEIGGGAHPSIQNREGLNYHIVDPDVVELEKAPSNITKMIGSVQELMTKQTYDLIISKMVLEHVESPDDFHRSVLGLLAPNGKAIHFFACKNSLPAIVNRFLSEKMGNRILRLLSNRPLDESPKYEAYYKRTKGHTMDQIRYFKMIGYNIEGYYSYVGHKYFKRVPLLNLVEKGYTGLLNKLNLKSLATVSLVVLKK